MAPEINYPNAVIETILKRRSTREEYSDSAVPIEVLEQIVQCGCNAPSSKNAQPWRFHVVSDRDLLCAIADAATDHPDAATYVPRDPATGKPRADWESTVKESAEVLRIAPHAMFVENKGAFSDGRGTVASATRESLRGSLVGYTFEILGIGAAITNVVLSAASLGVRSAFMGDIVIAEPFIRAALSMEGDLIGVIALGYSTEVVLPRGHLIDPTDPDRAIWH